jgi:hypothetical protein
MEIRELVHAVLAGDLLTARQWVADASRSAIQFEAVARPDDLFGRDLTVAAALVELLANRAGEAPPPWTHSVGPEREPLVLDPGLEQMPRSFAVARASGPEPLRKRNLIALPDFLRVA